MQPVTTSDLESFRAQALAAGFDEALERVWAPGQVVAVHSHPFDAQAVVVQGEMWLECSDGTQHLRPGEGFSLAAGTIHSETYGTEGATYWVARRRPA